MPSFKERLRAIEAQLRRQPGAAVFTILEIGGGLPCPVNFAYSGDMRWDRAADEEMDTFIRRSADAAIEAGMMSLVVGGLPKGDEYSKYNKPDGEFDFDAWWEAECAPTYSEVPPCEPIGSYRRPTSPVMTAALDRDRAH
jgi:hypothetical protein